VTASLVLRAPDRSGGSCGSGSASQRQTAVIVPHLKI